MRSTYDTNFTTPANHAGVTFLAATGDAGNPANYPAFSPNVLAVGGTMLTLDSNNNFSTETAWSSSGGGISSFESQPTYQNGVATAERHERTVPDVAMDAAITGSTGPGTSPGLSVYDSYNNWVRPPLGCVGGTSAWTPVLGRAGGGR